jgi:mono/diheme cytochrome c family protein
MRRSVMARLVLALAGGAPSLLHAQAADGKALFEKNCKACHGVRGVPPAALAKQQKIPKLDSAFVSARSDDSLTHVMKRGGKNMKGFDGKLSAEEMTAVAKYLRELTSAK